jgi:hypothetical protein
MRALELYLLLERPEPRTPWKLAPNPVDLMVIEGAGHYEMYDEPEYVDAAVGDDVSAVVGEFLSEQG